MKEKHGLLFKEGLLNFPCKVSLELVSFDNFNFFTLDNVYAFGNPYIIFRCSTLFTEDRILSTILTIPN